MKVSELNPGDDVFVNFEGTIIKYSLASLNVVNDDVCLHFICGRTLLLPANTDTNSIVFGFIPDKTRFYPRGSKIGELVFSSDTGEFSIKKSNKYRQITIMNDYDSVDISLYGAKSLLEILKHLDQEGELK